MPDGARRTRVEGIVQLIPTMKSQGAAKNEANNAAQSGAAAPAETKVAEKVDFSNVKIEPIFEEIQKYEEARDWLRSFYQDGKMTSLKTLTLQKEKLQQQIASEEEAISSLKEKLKDLDTADQNVDAILQMQIPEPVKSKTKDLER